MEDCTPVLAFDAFSKKKSEWDGQKSDGESND